jgi:hypothetical protein
MKAFVATLAGSLVAGFSFNALAVPPCEIPVEPKSSLTFMIGIAAEFGGSKDDQTVGITAKVLSTNKPNSVVFGGGVTFFPWAKDEQLGLDVSGGLLLNNLALLGGYDLLRQQLQVSGGWAPTMDSIPSKLFSIC